MCTLIRVLYISVIFCDVSGQPAEVMGAQAPQLEQRVGTSSDAAPSSHTAQGVEGSGGASGAPVDTVMGTCDLGAWINQFLQCS